eukprot:1641624-Alexandrium_andersonii.AAC.1
MPPAQATRWAPLPRGQQQPPFAPLGRSARRRAPPSATPRAPPRSARPLPASARPLRRGPAHGTD